MSPRQKMINMMYLVLLALLALNVSKEVLKAFHLMEVSFENTSKSHFESMKAALSGLDALEKENPEKATFFKERAIEAKQMAEELNQYLYEVQISLEEMGGGRMEEDEMGLGKAELKNGDDLETHANYFNPIEKKGKGHGLIARKKVSETRKKMLSLLISNAKDTLHQIPEQHYKELSLTTDLMIRDVVNAEGVTKKWEEMFLIETPLAAAVTNLARLRNECLNLANSIIDRLAKTAGASPFGFEDMKAFVKPNSNYVMAGSSYEADILLVAANSNSNYQIKIGGDYLPLSQGIGKYVAKAKGVGNHRLDGEIIMPGKDPLPFHTEWTSFMPSATISPTNMNVLYVGLDNPVQISVPGVDPSNVMVSIAGGTICKESGTKFMAKVSGGKKATVKVKARMSDGTIRSMGNMEFRVRQVPLPSISFGALTSGTYTPGAIMAQQNIQLYLKYFLFKGVSYQLVTYDMSVVDNDGRRKMNQYNISGKRIRLPKITPGDRIAVGNIKARAPGGAVVRVPGKLLLYAEK